MGQYVGLDVSLKETKVHVLDEQGQRVWRGRCASTPEAIEAVIRKHAPQAVRIGLDADDLAVAGADRCRVADDLSRCPQGQGGAEHGDRQKIGGAVLGRV
jgi:hypothetical protein